MTLYEKLDEATLRLKMLREKIAEHKREEKILLFAVKRLQKDSLSLSRKVASVNKISGMVVRLYKEDDQPIHRFLND
jgi:hypothetical protein